MLSCPPRLPAAAASRCAEVSPRLFSFNSPQGACPECSGLGSLREVDPEKLILDPERSLAAGCLATVGHVPGSWFRRQIEQLADHLGFDLHTPWRRLPEDVRQLIMYGSERELDCVWEGRKGAYRYRDRFEGVVPRLERRLAETTSEEVRGELERFLSFASCRACGGARLRREALAVQGGRQQHRPRCRPCRCGALWSGSRGSRSSGATPKSPPSCCARSRTAWPSWWRWGSTT